MLLRERSFYAFEFSEQVARRLRAIWGSSAVVALITLFQKENLCLFHFVEKLHW